MFALSGLSILFISSLQAGGKSKPKEHCKTFFYVYNTWMVFVRFNDFFNCSSNLTLGINTIFIISTIFYLYNICIEVTLVSFGSSSRMMLSLAMILLLVKKVSLNSKKICYLFCCYFLEKRFFSFYVVAFVFHFLRPRIFP